MANEFSKSKYGYVQPILGKGDATIDAWGRQLVSNLRSVYHGMWTYDVPPAMWLVYENGSEVATLTSTGAVSTDGALEVKSNGNNTLVESRRCPRYQPNRGISYATSVWCPNVSAAAEREWGIGTDENNVCFRLKADGKLYAVRTSGGVLKAEEEIYIPFAFDVTKGNVYDIQAQWRGVGNYTFYIGNPTTGVSERVHTFSLLGTLEELSIQNPATPVRFKSTNQGDDASLFSGCVDLSSAGGKEDLEQYNSAVNEKTVGSTLPVVAIYNPAVIGTAVNTRDVRLARISAGADKKATIAVWTTRDPTAFTGASFAAVANSGSYVQIDTAATAVNTAKLRQITTFTLGAAGFVSVNNPSRETIDFYLVRGDYLVVTGTGSTAAVTATIEWGEQI